MSIAVQLARQAVVERAQELTRTVRGAGTASGPASRCACDALMRAVDDLENLS